MRPTARGGWPSAEQMAAGVTPGYTVSGPLPTTAHLLVQGGLYEQRRAGEVEGSQILCCY